MPKYITLAQYRAQDAGIIGTATNAGITDVALARHIAQAESDIDSYMAFAEYLNGGFEAHLTGLLQMGFNQYTRRLSMPQFPVPARNVQRYRIHISNASNSGAGLFATIQPGDAVINQGAGYIEIVPLQAITYSLAPIVWDLGLEPPLIEADLEVGYYLPAFGAPLYNDSGDLKTYRALNSAWASVYTQAISNQPNTLPPVPPTIYANGVPVTGVALSTALALGVAVTSLAVTALPSTLTGGTVLALSSSAPGGASASVTLSGTATAGATSLAINSFTPAAPFPVGSFLAPGLAVNFAEGLAVYGAARSASDVITADYTYTIPNYVRDAAIAQTTWRLALRNVAQIGALPFDLVRNGEQQVRRKEASSGGVSSLCTEALKLIEKYKPIPIG